MNLSSQIGEERRLAEDTVERWLADAAIGWARVSIGDKSYVVERPRVGRDPEKQLGRQVAEGSE